MSAVGQEWSDWPTEALAEERRFREARGQVAAGAAPAMASEERIEIQGHSALRCIPRDCKSDVAHVFCHGGGWVFGSSLQSLGLIRRIAHQARRPVVSIDYPLAPEHRYPLAVQSVATVMTQLAEEGGLAGIIGGSAGAQVALHALAQDKTAPACGAVLFCGAFGSTIDTWSHDSFGSVGGRLTSDTMQRFYNAYFDPAYAPTLNLATLPPVYLSVGDCDPLLSDSLDLYRDLALHRSVGDRLEVIPGMSHGFMNDWFRTNRVERAVEDAVSWLEDRSTGSEDTYKSPSGPSERLF